MMIKMIKAAQAQHPMILQLMKTPPKNSSVVSKKNEVVAYLARNIKMLKRSQYPTTDLKPGDLCPTLCGGKLYSLKPSAILKIDGARRAFDSSK